MTTRKRTWLIGIGGIAVTVLVALSVAGYVLANRFEPYVREQVISYLERRFDSQVELAALRVRVPRFSPVRALFRRGRGVLATVEGDGVLLRHRGRRDLPPMFSMKRISFQVDLGALLDEIKVAHLVTIDGMEINVPPKGERPQLVSGADTQGDRNLRGPPANLEIHPSMEPIASTTRTLASFPASPVFSSRPDDSKAVSRRFVSKVKPLSRTSG